MSTAILNGRPTLEAHARVRSTEQALKLIDLPPMDLAMMLAAKGITGRQFTGDRCPLSKLLSERIGLPVIVGDTHAVVRVSAATSIECPLPEQACTFVRMFDLGRFPNLIASRTN